MSRETRDLFRSFLSYNKFKVSKWAETDRKQPMHMFIMQNRHGIREEYDELLSTYEEKRETDKTLSPRNFLIDWFKSLSPKPEPIPIPIEEEKVDKE